MLPARSPNISARPGVGTVSRRLPRRRPIGYRDSACGAAVAIVVLGRTQADPLPDGRGGAGEGR
jgi:hypothetical protein